MKKIIIIGAGLGGLAAACRLAQTGFAVTVLEKNKTAGGKVNLIESGGYRFDTGASLITLPRVFEELFAFCGKRAEDYLAFEKLDPICRYRWPDGTMLDASPDPEKTESEIARIAPEDVGAFRRYIADARRKFEIAERTFLERSANELPQLLTAKNLPDLLKISSLKTLDRHNRKFFRSEKLRQLFNRYATYNGSSPYKIPAVFSLIPYAEFGFGAWYARGGIYRIPEALERLARELGVGFVFGREAEKILVKNGKAAGVKLKNELDDEDILEADIVVSNADAVVTYRELIEEKDRPGFPDKKLNKREPSSSGFVLLLGAAKKFSQLAHHNIFFSDDYPTEFRHIFDVRIPTPNPTIYVCASSVTDAAQAPAGCENLFVLVNVPYMRWQVNWQFEAAAYRDVLVRKLEQSGLEDLGVAIEFEETITPEDFEQKYRANKGSIYGLSSNGVLAAFRRIPNRSSDIRNLYFTGGATHPGGGMPLVLLSAKMTADLIVKEKLRSAA